MAAETDPWLVQLTQISNTEHSFDKKHPETWSPWPREFRHPTGSPGRHQTKSPAKKAHLKGRVQIDLG